MRGAPDEPRLSARFQVLGSEVRGALLDLRDDLRRGEPRPAMASLADRIVDSVPPVQMTPGVFEVAGKTVPRAAATYREAIGRLVLRAEALDNAAPVSQSADS